MGKPQRRRAVGPVRHLPDDPRDQAAIQIGIDLYEQAGPDLTRQEFYRAFYRHVVELYQ